MDRHPHVPVDHGGMQRRQSPILVVALTWLVTLMRYDLGYFAEEKCRLEPIEKPFSPKVLPMSPE